MASLEFHALVLETTDRCNARCGMCYQSAGPKGSDVRGDHNLTLDTTLRVIEEAARLPNLASRLHVSGGEAFIKYANTLRAFQRAAEVGFLNIGTTTNGFWAINDRIAEKKCVELVQAGVTYFEVSMDHWHLPYIPLKRVRTLLRAARRVGVNVILRTLSSRSHHLEGLFDEFSDEELFETHIGNGRVAPVGRAATEIPMTDVYEGQGPVGRCEDMLCLTVAPNGNVYPCCAGADMTDSLASGNVNSDSLPEIVFKMETDRTIREIVHSGTGSLIPIVQELGFGDRLQPSYASICHLCWDVFKDDEMASALRGYFADKQLSELVSLLEATPAE